MNFIDSSLNKQLITPYQASSLTRFEEYRTSIVEDLIILQKICRTKSFNSSSGLKEN